MSGMEPAAEEEEEEDVLAGTAPSSWARARHVQGVVEAGGVSAVC